MKTKEQIREHFESCFETKLEDVFTEKGLKKFWSNDTSVDEALDMCDTAVFHIATKKLGGDALGAMIIMAGAMCETHEQKDNVSKDKDTDFNVYDTKRQAFVLFGYSSYDEAFEEAKNYCLENGVKLSDVKVCQIYE